MPDAADDTPASHHYHAPRHHGSHYHAGQRPGHHMSHRTGRNPLADAATTDHDAAERGEADFYAVLGVSHDATPDEVRHAYHRLAKLWHPDRFMAAPPALRERAERRTRALNAAYAVLGDAERRAAYDLRLPPPAHHHQRAGMHAAPDAARSAMGVRDVFENGHATVAPERDGTGMFLGALIAVLALALILTALKQQPVGPGGYLTLGLGVILAGIAFWCATQENMLARLANQILAGAPPARAGHAGGGPGRPHHARDAQHAPHSHEDHPEHAAREASQTPASASTATPPAATDPDDADDAAFEQLVAEAVETIPDEFKTYLNNVAVRVKRSPSAQEIARLSLREHGLLLGLYEGVDVTRQGAAGAPQPEVITIYRRPIERYCQRDPDRIREQVRRTVLHELAHHFGIDHDAMPGWLR